MRNIYVPLPEAAADKLRELARREFRDPKAQATVLILDGLCRAGLDVEAHVGGHAGAAPAGRER